MTTTKQHFGIQIIGRSGDPYLKRYILFRWWHLPRVYVHKFLRSDDDRALHNHPWWFFSVVLKGQYLEFRGDSKAVVRKRFSVAFRNLDTFHRVELIDGKPCWTLIVTGPDIRSWGFLCRGRNGNQVVPWREFDGCGE